MYLQQRGWKVFYTSNHFINDYDPSKAEIAGYFGIAFINSSEIVIAHRGTIVSSSIVKAQPLLPK
jgi:hypothetical protein